MHVKEGLLHGVVVGDHPAHEHIRAAGNIGEPLPQQTAGAGLCHRDPDPALSRGVEQHRRQVGVGLAVDVIAGALANQGRARCERCIRFCRR